MERVLTPETIREIRTEMRMTQTELANFLDVERNTITRWEMGIHYPVGRRATKLLRELRRIRNANQRVEQGRPASAAQEVTFVTQSGDCGICGLPGDGSQCDCKYE